MTILFLHKSSFSSAQRALITSYMRSKVIQIDPAKDVFFASIHNRVSKLWIRKPKTKNKWMINEEKRVEFFKTLDFYISQSQATLIVINDTATLGYLTNYYSLDLCRGSVYYYKNIPCVVLDDVLKCTYKIQDGSKKQPSKYAPWIFLQDLAKIKRWHSGNKRPEPKFTYRVVRGLDTCAAFVHDMATCFYIGIDIETVGNLISCISFTGINQSGQLVTWVVPFINPTCPENCAWPEKYIEVLIWQAVRAVLENDAIKVFQNGAYDNAYFIRYRCATRNWFVDTSHLFHSIWTEAPKKLNFISSIVLDHCRYWKDELKGDKDEKIPSTVAGMEKYWRYCALDTYNTVLDSIWLINLILHPSMAWATRNYDTEFSGQVGPALAMSMTGCNLNRKRQQTKNIEWLKQHEKKLKELRIMCNDPTFNPNSPYEVASLIYDVLGAKPIKMRGKNAKGPRSVDEKILKLIKIQHPLYDLYIEKIWDTKKPLNNSAKYGSQRISFNNRFVYQYGAGGTETGRYNGKQHQFWYGQQPHNIPAKVRDMIQADPGYILVDLDYRQSDLWFVAGESEDPDLRRNISDDRDTHCVHAEFFFKKPYAEILQGHIENLDWVDHPIKGVRQNTKRITHGASYRMMAFTLYVEMGHEAVVETARALGYKNAHLLSRDQLVAICEKLLIAYYQLYLRLKTWFQTSTDECVKNGNLATCAFGRTRRFFGDLKNNPAIQRELSAYYGQGGTAGNINRTLIDFYYQSDLMDQGFILLLQTHDSITGQVPFDKLFLIEKFLTIMQQPCTIKGWEFTVPVDANVGISWSKKAMLKWHKDITVQEILDYEKAYALKNYPDLLEAA